MDATQRIVGRQEVSMRALNHHSSRVIHAVRDERREFIVTERGKPVAMIVPIEQLKTPLDRMLASGEARAARTTELPPAASGDPGIEAWRSITSERLRELLDHDREDRW